MPLDTTANDPGAELRAVLAIIRAARENWPEVGVVLATANAGWGLPAALRAVVEHALARAGVDAGADAAFLPVNPAPVAPELVDEAEAALLSHEAPAADRRRLLGELARRASAQRCPRPRAAHLSQWEAS